MEFLVHIEVHWPPDGNEEIRKSLVAAEAARARELASAGTIRRLWRVPGRWENWGLWEAPDATALHRAIESLPFYRWLRVEVHPLALHHSDPVVPSRAGSVRNEPSSGTEGQSKEIPGFSDSGRVQSWRLDELQAEILNALASGSAGDGQVVDGRALAVKASPLKYNSSKIVVGMAALPPNFTTKPHRHEAEEVAVVISGTGFIEVNDLRFPVAPGAVVLVPSEASHMAHSDEGKEPLVELWFYAPPGSERRWMSAELTRDT